MANGHGGARPGAGRPRKRVKYARPINQAEKKIADHLPEIVDGQIVLALGVRVQEFDEEAGELVVYQKPPDRQAGQYLLDRIMGKPTERKEIAGDDGGAVLVRVVYDDLPLEGDPDAELPPDGPS